jgi:hypothetical protein
VIYNFMALCLAYVGGPGAVELKMNGYVLLPSWTAATCCLPPMPVSVNYLPLPPPLVKEPTVHTCIDTMPSKNTGLFTSLSSNPLCRLMGTSSV